MSAGLTVISMPIVDAAPDVGVAEQKLPKPWVGQTIASPGSSAASLRTDPCWALASSVVWSAPSRSVLPVDPLSSEPPVKTATIRPATSTAKDRWLNVWPGVAITLTPIWPASIWSPSAIPIRSNSTSSAAFT